MSNFYKINYIVGGSTNVGNSLTSLAQALATAQEAAAQAAAAAAQAAAAAAQAQALYDAAVAQAAAPAVAAAPAAASAAGTAPTWTKGQMRERITRSLKTLYEEGYNPIIDESKNTITITRNGVKVVIKLNPENYIFSGIELEINGERVQNGPALKVNPMTFRLSDIPKYLDEDDTHNDSSRKYFTPMASN